jgi:hypothetical protein
MRFLDWVMSLNAREFVGWHTAFALVLLAATFVVKTRETMRHKHF